MRNLTFFNSGLKAHRLSLFSIFILMLIITIAGASVVTIRINSGTYVLNEMKRLGFGDLTLWITGFSENDNLINDIEALKEVDSISGQKIIISDYEILEQESDSEGQLITYTPSSFSYKFISDDLSDYRKAPEEIIPGEIYVSPSMVTIFGAGIDDQIDFIIARNGVVYSFKIKGFFEDPFMGSSMIGMKSFLISDTDYENIIGSADSYGIDSLARNGLMLHVVKNKKDDISIADLNRIINEHTDLPKYTEFTHSREVLVGFMLILQNIFSALLIAFTIVLLVTAFIVMGHAISSSITEEKASLSIMKTIGYSGRHLRSVLIIQFILPVILAAGAGLVLSPAASAVAIRMMLTTSGILIPPNLPLPIILLGFTAQLSLVLLFLFFRTRPVALIEPVKAIRQGLEDYKGRNYFSLGKSFFRVRLALRQVLSGKMNYLSALFIALLLVFFSSLIGRIDSWIGPNGEGLMDAFNPAEHDLGVQIFSDLEREEIESLITEFSPITDTYELAMESVALNGVNYTANIITEPSRLHILKGRAGTGDDEVVLTEFLASDIGAEIGDTVTLSAAKGSEEYIVTGFYQCANDMGDNFGLSRQGYLKIAFDNPAIWCVHYFLEKPDMRIPLMEELEQRYRADIHVHENGWPGLYGIISAMRLLMIFMYIIAAAVIFTAVILSGNKILKREQHDIAVYRVLGFSVHSLRISFALRFLIVSFLGAFFGALLSSVLTDPIVDVIMRFAGVSGFNSHPGFTAAILPVLIITLCFTLFSYFISDRIRRAEMNSLIARV